MRKFAPLAHTGLPYVAAVEYLLRPVTFPPESVISTQRSILQRRVDQIHGAFPFLEPLDRLRANRWIEEANQLYPRKTLL